MLPSAVMKQELRIKFFEFIVATVTVALFFESAFCNHSGSPNPNWYVHSMRCVSKKSGYDAVGYVLSRQTQFQLLATDSDTIPEVTHVGGGVGLDVEGKV